MKCFHQISIWMVGKTIAESNPFFNRIIWNTKTYFDGIILLALLHPNWCTLSVNYSSILLFCVFVRYVIFPSFSLSLSISVHVWVCSLFSVQCSAFSLYSMIVEMYFNFLMWQKPNMHNRLIFFRST